MDKAMLSLMETHATILGNQAAIERALKHQHDCIEALKAEVAQFRDVMAEVKDLLAALNVTSRIVKYIAFVGAALLSMWEGGKAAWRAW